MKFKKINVERMRYKNDSTSFWLCMIGLVFNVIQLSKIYSNIYLQSLVGKEEFSYYYIGLDIVYNIIFMLVTFYTAEELKTYHIKWTLAPLIIGILQIARISKFPTMLLQFEYYDEALFAQIRLCHIISALAFFGATLVGFVKSTLLSRFLGKKTPFDALIDKMIEAPVLKKDDAK